MPTSLSADVVWSILALGALGTGLAKVREGLSPHLHSEGMVREAFNVLINAVGIQPFDGRDNPGMEGTPTLLRQAAISHLLRQRVLEHIFKLWKQACLIEKLGGLQMDERAV